MVARTDKYKSGQHILKPNSMIFKAGQHELNPNSIYKGLYRLIPQPGNGRMRQWGWWVGSGGGTHYILLRDLEPYLTDCQAPLALLLFSLAELLLGPFGGASEPSLPWSTARVCLALPVMKRLDSWITTGNRT